MKDRHRDAGAFMDFMKAVTGPPSPDEPETDPHELRISELERQVRALQRSVRRGAARRRSVRPGQG